MWRASHGRQATHTTNQQRRPDGCSRAKRQKQPSAASEPSPRMEIDKVLAKGLGVQEMIIQGLFPFCFTPELYAAKPDYIDKLAAFAPRGSTEMQVKRLA